MNKTQQAVLDSQAYRDQADRRRGESPSAVLVVQSWHDEVHRGDFRLCGEQPCHALHYQSGVGA